MRNHKIGFYLFSILMFCSCMLKAEKFVLTMNWTPQAEFAGYYVAKEKGFWKCTTIPCQLQCIIVWIQTSVMPVFFR